MRKDVARALKAKAEETARKYSSKTRANNFNGESFKVDEIIPISAQGAMVIFSKSTGKKALAHFIHVDHPKNPFWQYYIMGSQHFINLNMLERKYAEIEKHNFELNFEHIPKENHESDLPEM